MSDIFLQKKQKHKSSSVCGREKSEFQSIRNLNSTLTKTLQQNGKPLPCEERAFFESRFGYNFSEVRIHENGQAAVARNISAQAFTLGNDIVLENRILNNKQRQRLLAHELTHVIQQSKPNGLQNSNISAEAEAENNSRHISGNNRLTVNSASSSGIIQRKPKSKVDIENSGTKKEKDSKPGKNENKYSFSAETKVPLPGSPEFGKLSLLDNKR